MDNKILYIGIAAAAAYYLFSKSEAPRTENATPPMNGTVVYDGMGRRIFSDDGQMNPQARTVGIHRSLANGGRLSKNSVKFLTDNNFKYSVSRRGKQVVSPTDKWQNAVHAAAKNLRYEGWVNNFAMPYGTKSHKRTYRKYFGDPGHPFFTSPGWGSNPSEFKYRAQRGVYG
jgi:hypothetical protein